MPKSDLPMPGDYAPVADRIQLFYERFPKGQILSDLVSQRGRRITFKASIYREPADARPSATGWASERIGDGEVNSVACVENTETSAIGRALANLGFTASRHRPSAEEMAKVAREKARLASNVRQRANHLRVAEPRGPGFVGDLQYRANSVADVLSLVAEAERLGLRAGRSTLLRNRLAQPDISAVSIERLRLRVQAWLDRRRHERLAAEQETARAQDSRDSSRSDERS
jgi:hypothetical protein